MGVVSAIGNSVAENHQALKDGVCGVKKELTLFPSKYAGLLPFGQVPISSEALRNQLQITERGVTRTSLLAVHALEQALENSGLSTADIISAETALIGANTVGGMCLTDELYADANTKESGSEYTSSYDCASVNLFLHRKFHLLVPGDFLLQNFL